ncbi:TRADD-N-associated membrane domain-containing protein [Teredinibacter turnerae]|uniref:TRADD-N-associated membrane domain-containing protein n=1 Tax=Teredinibacter turnerae TaxID=2426 RepID=UPI00036EA54E|nr:hypothetical protein [Teredinibacter turnerae]
MSIEVTLITSLLASVLGSTALAESLVKLFKEKFDNKTTKNTASDELQVSDRQKLYLTGDQESEIATEAAIEALDETYHSTAGIVSERMRQAKLAFNVAISLMVVGVVIVFAGIGLLWVKESFESGLITVAVGAVSEIISLLVFKFNSETNNRLDVLRKDLSIIETARVGLSIAKQIENQEKRDHAISQLSLRLQNG